MSDRESTDGPPSDDGLSSDDLLADAKREFGLADGSSGVADSLLESSFDGEDFSMTAEEIAAELAPPEVEGPAETSVTDFAETGVTDFADTTPQFEDAPLPSADAYEPPRPFDPPEPPVADTPRVEPPPVAVPETPVPETPVPETPVPAPEPVQEPAQEERGGFLSTLWRNRWIVVVAIVGISIVAGLLDNSEPVGDLNAGDCFIDPGAATEVSDVDVVDCDKEHDLEVFGSVALFGSEYPGDFEVADQAFTECLDAFEGYVGQAYETSILYVLPFTPTEDSWDAGDREALCVVYEPVPGTDGIEVAPRTGSVRGSGL